MTSKSHCPRQRHLVVAAHPDDEILGCGGTIARYHGRDDFFVLILTGGAQGRYDRSMEEQLRGQALEANRLVGTKEVFFEDLPNQGLDAIPLTRVIHAIEVHIARLKPEVLWIHDDADLNKDHRIVYEAGVTAARPLAGQVVGRVYSYFVASSTEWGRQPRAFAPNTFVDIKDSLETKSRAMQCYTSECRAYPHPRSPQAVHTYAAYWGLGAGWEYAEPFRLVQRLRGI